MTKVSQPLTPGSIYYIVNTHKLDHNIKKIHSFIKKNEKFSYETNSDGKPVYTSENTPMQVDFIPDEDLYLTESCRLGICMAPGRKKKKKQWEWRRDLSADLDRMRDEYKVDVLVSLVRHAGIW